MDNTPARHRIGLLTRLRGILFGHDFFISYSHRPDSFAYAERLERALRSRDMAVFRDKSEIQGGDPLTTVIRIGLRRTAVLLVIASEAATKSEWVAKEISMFTKWKRKIVPIDIEDVRDRHPWPELREREVLFLADTPEGPSAQLLDQVSESLERLRVNTKARIALGIVTIATLALAVSVFIQSLVVSQQADRIRGNAVRLAAERAGDPTHAALILANLDSEPDHGMRAALRAWGEEQSQFILKEHEGPISGLAADPTKGQFVSASWDGSVRLWSLDDGSSQVLPHTDQDKTPTWVCFDDTGQHVSVGFHNGSAWSWDLLSAPRIGVQLGAPRAHSQGIISQVFRRGGAHVATFGRDGRVAIWDSRTGAMAGEIQVPEGSNPVNVWSHARKDELVVLTTTSLDRYASFGLGRATAVRSSVLPDLEGASLTTKGEVVLAHATGKIEIFRIDNPTALTVIKGKSGSTFSPYLLRSASGDILLTRRRMEPHVDVWDPERGKLKGILEGITGLRRPLGERGGARLHAVRIFGSAGQASARPHSEGRSKLAISPDGRWLAMTPGGDLVYLWYLPVNPANDDPRILEGHRQAITALTFAHDSTALITADGAGTIRVWNIGDQSGRVYYATAPVRRVAWDDRGSILALPETRPCHYSVPGEPVRRVLPTGARRPMAWCISSTGPRVIWKGARRPSRKAEAWLWDGANISEIPMRPDAHLDRATFSPDGTEFALGWSDGTVSVRYVETRELAAEYDPHEGRGGQGHRAMTLGYSPDGTALFSLDLPKAGDGATASFLTRESSVDRFDPRTARTFEMDSMGGTVLSWRWTADAPRVAVRRDRVLSLWAVSPMARGQQVYEGELGQAVAAISPDASRVAIGDRDGLAHVVTIRGAHLTLDGHETGSPIEAIAFSPSGSRLITSGRDQTARVWELPPTTVTATSINSLVRVNHAASVRFAAFKSDTEAITASNDGTVRIWPLEWEDIRPRLAQTTRACLPARTHEQVLGDDPSRANEKEEACRARQLTGEK